MSQVLHFLYYTMNTTTIIFCNFKRALLATHQLLSFGGQTIWNRFPRLFSTSYLQGSLFTVLCCGYVSTEFKYDLQVIWLSLWRVYMYVSTLYMINTLRPRQNGRIFADDTFKRIFLNENIRISIKISLKFVPKGPINNIPAMVQIMAWRRPGDKPLSEPMMGSLPTYICVTRPQWVKCNTWIISCVCVLQT